MQSVCDTEPAVSVAPPVQQEEVIVEPEPAATPLTPNATQDTPDEQLRIHQTSNPAGERDESPCI